MEKIVRMGGLLRWVSVVADGLLRWVSAVAGGLLRWVDAGAGGLLRWMDRYLGNAAIYGIILFQLDCFGGWTDI